MPYKNKEDRVKWNKSNRDKVSEYTKKYREKYPERVRETIKKRGSYNKIRVLREKVINRDGNICRKCGTSEDLTLEHKIPRVAGGKNHLSNLEILCKKCNTETYHLLVKKALIFYFKYHR